MTHYYLAEDPEKLADSTTEFPFTYYPCFGSYYQVFNKNTDFYIGFEVDPKVLQAFSADFNNNFKNIRMIPYDPIIYYFNHNSYQGGYFSKEKKPSPKEIKSYSPNCSCKICEVRPNREYYLSFFKLEYDKKYDTFVRYVFNPIIGQLFRLFVHSEFCGNQDEKFSENPERHFKDDLLKKSWELDGLYPNCVLYRESFDRLLAFDNITIMNRAFENEYYTVHSKYYRSRMNLSYRELPYPTVVFEFLRTPMVDWSEDEN